MGGGGGACRRVRRCGVASLGFGWSREGESLLLIGVQIRNPLELVMWVSGFVSVCNMDTNLDVSIFVFHNCYCFKKIVLLTIFL